MPGFTLVASDFWPPLADAGSWTSNVQNLAPGGCHRKVPPGASPGASYRFFPAPKTLGKDAYLEREFDLSAAPSYGTAPLDAEPVLGFRDWRSRGHKQSYNSLHATLWLAHSHTLTPPAGTVRVELRFSAFDSWDRKEAVQIYLNGELALSFQPLPEVGNPAPSRISTSCGNDYDDWMELPLVAQASSSDGQWLRLRINTTLDQPANDESWAIQARDHTAHIPQIPVVRDHPQPPYMTPFFASRFLPDRDRQSGETANTRPQERWDRPPPPLACPAWCPWGRGGAYL